MGISSADIDQVEALLGRRFPDGYRKHIEQNGTGAIVSTIDLYVELWSLEVVTDVNLLPELTFPDLVRFGGDGSREQLAFDYRTEPPRIVMLDITASDEGDLIEQALSFEEFIGGLNARGLDFGV